MKSEHLTISEVSKILEVSEKTLRIWDKKGILIAEKTEGGHRRYKSIDIKILTKFRQNIDIKKDNEFETSISDEFSDQDLNFHKDKTKECVDFWSKRGHLSEKISRHDENLAVILTNQMNFSQTISIDLDDDLMVDIIVEMWKNIVSKSYVNIGSMPGPTSLLFTANDKGIVESFPISAVTRVFKNEFILTTEIPDEIKLLEPLTFEPIKKKPVNFRFDLSVSRDYLIKYNAKKMAKEIDDEVVEDLWNNAEIVSYEEDLYSKKVLDNTNYIVTNEFGIEIMKQNKLFTGYENNCFLNEKINGIIFGKKNDSFSGLNGFYFYNIYIPFYPSPIVMTTDGIMKRYFMTRYSKKIMCKEGKLFKLIF